MPWRVPIVLMASSFECIWPGVCLMVLLWLMILGIPLAALISRNFTIRPPGLSPMCK